MYCTFSPSYFFLLSITCTGFQWVLFTLQFWASFAIPDEPESTRIQEQRSAFLNEKLILRVADYEDEEDKLKIEGRLESVRNSSKNQYRNCFHSCFSCLDQMTSRVSSSNDSRARLGHDYEPFPTIEYPMEEYLDKESAEKIMLTKATCNVNVDKLQ